MKAINFDDSQFMLMWYCINLVLKNVVDLDNKDRDTKTINELLHDLVDDVYKQAHGNDYDSRAQNDYLMLK